MKEIRDFLDDDAIVVADGGDTQVWTILGVEIPRPGQLLSSGPFGCLGVGIPFALAAKLRYPEAGLDIIEPQLSVEPLGIAIGKEDRQFANLLRNYLHAFEKVGLIPNLRKKWFENNSWMATLP